MRAVIVTLCCAFPVIAQAQDKIPNEALQRVYERCVPACQETRSYAFCSRICACSTDEMSRYWTTAELRDKGAALSRDPNAGEVRGQLDRIAAFCADRAS